GSGGGAGGGGGWGRGGGQPRERIGNGLGQGEGRAFEQAQGTPDAAFGQRGGLAQLVVLGVASKGQGSGASNIVREQRPQRQPPAARADRGQEPGRRVADQEQQGIARRLLQNLQERVGSLRILQLVSGVDDADTPAPLARGRSEERHGAAHVVDPDHRID